MKLDHYGVRGNSLKWIQDFLSGRTQQVVLEGSSSDVSPVTSGVPQGSVLGPLLFLVFINDLPSRVKAAAGMFADDAALQKKIRNEDDAADLQKDLDSLQSWEKEWQMQFNPDKCEVIHVTTKKEPIRFPYQIHNTRLNQPTKQNTWELRSPLASHGNVTLIISQKRPIPPWPSSVETSDPVQQTPKLQLTRRM